MHISVLFLSWHYLGVVEVFMVFIYLYLYKYYLMIYYESSSHCMN